MRVLERAVGGGVGAGSGVGFELCARHCQQNKVHLLQGVTGYIQAVFLHHQWDAFMNPNALSSCSSREGE